MKLNKKQEILIAAVLGVIFLFLVGKFLISGLYSDLKELYQQIKISETQLKKGLRVQKNKDEISEDYKKYETYLQAPEKNERRVLAELLKEAESIVRSVGGTIINLSPQEGTETKDTFQQYKVNFRIEMKFAQLLRFLKEVQENKRLVSFEKLTVTASGDGADNLMVEGTINLAISL